MNQKDLLNPEIIKQTVDKSLKEYKEFAFKGSIFEMSVAFIIGAAFTKVITSVTENIIMPVLNYVVHLTGSESWKDIVWMPYNGLTIEIGKFANSFVDFLLVSFVLFIVWKLFRRKQDV